MTPILHIVDHIIPLLKETKLESEFMSVVHPAQSIVKTSVVKGDL